MPDFFDQATFWRANPLEAFRAFVQSTDFLTLSRHRPYEIGADGSKVVRPLRGSSANVYIQMFGTFTRWLAAQDLGIYEVTSAHIREFLDATHLVNGKPAKKLNSSIRVRYLRLFERVFAHLDVEPNPAQHAAFIAYKEQATGKDRPKVILTEAQQIEFLRALPAVEPASPENMLNASWKRRRDRAMLAMMIGAGLKVSEVIGIRTGTWAGSRPVVQSRSK
jgi:site-specific recombinase XerD